MLERRSRFWNGLIVSNEEMIASVVHYLCDFFFVKIKDQYILISFSKKSPIIIQIL